MFNVISLVYALEAILKILGFGLIGYFSSGWNIFDFSITSLAVFGLIGENFHFPFSFIFILRSLRLLKLFELKKRYRDIMGTFIFIIMKRFGFVSIVVLIAYYFFAIIGMELFSSFDLKDCCKNSTVEQYFAWSNATVKGYYYLNNFDNIASSYGKHQFTLNRALILSIYILSHSDFIRAYGG